eukprot:c23952_g1_i1 orf=1-1314(-)
MRESADESEASSFLGAAPTQSNRKGKACKVAGAIVAPILFAAAIFFVVLYSGAGHYQAVPQHHEFDLQEEGMSAAASVSGSKGLVSSICKHTEYPVVCGRELSGFRIPLLASPLEVIRFAVQAAANRVNEAQSLATNFTSRKGLSLLEDQCSNDCVELLQSVTDQMNLAAVRLSGLSSLTNVASLRSALVDVKVWLSSSLSYQTACSDNFEVAPGSVQERIWSNQAYLTEVLGVSLNLVDILSQIGNTLAPWLGALPPTPPFIHFRRRLLSAGAGGSVDEFPMDEEFPAWVSAGDRRLLQASSSSITANAVVAKDGSGQYKTVTAAVNAIPSSYSGRYVIYIKAGVYNEVLNVTKDQKNVTFVGDGIGKTIITGNRNVASGDYNTYRTSTVGIAGSGFYGRDLTFRNTAGASGHQAVALRAGADFLVFYRCSFEGYQD